MRIIIDKLQSGALVSIEENGREIAKHAVKSKQDFYKVINEYLFEGSKKNITNGKAEKSEKTSKRKL